MKPPNISTKTLALVLVVAVCSAGIAYNSATASIIPDYVGGVEMDAYRDGWTQEAAWPASAQLTGLQCPVRNGPSTCASTANPACPRPGVVPGQNVQLALAVVRIATVIYAAYKAQAHEPYLYEVSYPSVVAQLEGTLDTPARRTEWASWVNANPKRLQELRRAYQTIPAWNILQRAEYKRLIDPGNQLSLDTVWTQG